MFDGQLDVPVVSMLEQKFGNCRFTRVDSDITERLIIKEDIAKTTLSDNETANLSSAFNSQMPKLDNKQFIVDVQSLGAEGQPVIITQNEYMRRMKDISKFQPGMAFYGQMPDSYTLVLNADHPLIKRVLDDESAKCGEKLSPIDSEIKAKEALIAAMQQDQNKKKAEEITQAEKDEKADAEKALREEKDKRNNIIAEYAKDNKVVHQLIDLALLQNGMLKGEALNSFLRRSVELI